MQRFAAQSTLEGGYNAKLKGKAVMPKLHKEEEEALKKTFPKDFEVCRDARPQKGSKYAYEVESCLPLPFNPKSKFSMKYEINGVASKNAYKKARDKAKKVVETPMEWNICGKVQYKCIRQIAMDGKSCSVQVDDEGKMTRLAKKAKLPIAQTSKCVKMDVHGRRHLGEEDVSFGGASALSAADGLGFGSGVDGGAAGSGKGKSYAAWVKKAFLGRLRRWAGHSITRRAGEVGVGDVMMQSPGLQQHRDSVVGGGEDGAANGEQGAEMGGAGGALSETESDAEVIDRAIEEGSRIWNKEAEEEEAAAANSDSAAVVAAPRRAVRL